MRDDTFRVIGHAFLQRERTFDALERLQKRDRGRRSRQREPSAGAAMRVYQPALHQRLKYLREESLGNALRLADLVDHNRANRRLTGQIQQPDDGVFICASDLHDKREKFAFVSEANIRITPCNVNAMADSTCSLGLRGYFV